MIDHDSIRNAIVRARQRMAREELDKLSLQSPYLDTLLRDYSYSVEIVHDDCYVRVESGYYQTDKVIYSDFVSEFNLEQAAEMVVLDVQRMLSEVNN